MDLIKLLKNLKKDDIESFKVGDTVKVHFKIVERKRTYSDL